MKAGPKTVDVVLVTWNSTDILFRCLDSLAKSATKDVRVNITVVDNGSSVRPTRADFPPNLVTNLITNERNLGFARACNAGAAEGSSEYLLFLNPDTLVGDGVLRTALDFMASPEHADTAILGVRTTDIAGTTHRTCAHLPTFRMLLNSWLFLDRAFPRACPGFLMRNWDHSETKYVDHVIGAFFIVRREVFLAMRGFDESFFVYLEDLDFCARARQRDMKVVFLANVSVFHQQGGVSRQDIAHRMFHSEQSRIIYTKKHFGRIRAMLLLTLSFAVALPLRLITGMFRGSWSDVRNTLIAYFRLALCARRLVLTPSRHKP